MVEGIYKLLHSNYTKPINLGNPDEIALIDFAREIIALGGNNNKIVFIRIEQLYPFPAKTLAKVLKKYKNAEFYWCQEEPKNMGGWNTVRNYIDRTLEIIAFKNKKVK